MTKRILLFSLFIVLSIVSLSNDGFGQTPAGERVTVKGAGNYAAPTEGRLASKLMGREMPYRVVLPADYATSKDKHYPVIYLLHGLTGHYNNWTDRSSLGATAVDFKVIIVMPEGNNGWYTDSVSKESDKYESYVVKELIPEIDAKYRTIKARNGRSIAGLSMGGYGGLKFGLKYPETFSLAGSFSGALGAASFTEKNAGVIGKSLESIFGAVESDTRRANDIFAIIRNTTPEKIKNFPFLYIDCGTEDILFQNNRDFVELLLEKGVPHEFRQLPGGHTWAYWDKQVLEFLQLASARMK